jgi:GNAT superfamily N-acetyltransferase
MTDILIRPIQSSEIGIACDLAMRVFMQFIAPLHDEEGIARFGDYVYPPAMASRQHGHFALVAEVDGQIVGVAEMRDYRHLSMLFVEAAYQKQGISRQLWDAARNICLAKHPDIPAFTVNAAPNSVPIYAHFGFVATDVEQIRNSVRYVPMKLTL